MTDTEKISVRVPVELVEDLEDIVLRRRYRNVSEALRDAVEEFVQRNKPNAPGVLEVSVPNGLLPYMNDLLELQEFRDMQDIIVFALRMYLEQRILHLKDDMLQIEEGKTLALRRLSQRLAPRNDSRPS